VAAVNDREGTLKDPNGRVWAGSQGLRRVCDDVRMANIPDGFVYVTGPIDWWPAWTKVDTPPVEDYGNYAGMTEAEHAASTLREREELLESAKEKFRAAGWEGDVTMGPYFAGLPTDDETGRTMVGLKQSNNGTTFIWSPLELPWLGKPA